jgi:hypothetical protein
MPAPLAFILLAATLASAAEPIAIVETRTVGPDPGTAAHASHDLKLHAYAFRGTRWTADEIVIALAGAARLLAQCAIAFAGAELRVLETPRRFHFYSTPVSRELLRALGAAKPAVFFVEDTRNVPAFDAEAIGLANARGREELANTVWVAHGAGDLTLTLAHELVHVHVLADSGAHSVEPGNLMRDETAPGNTRLDDAQCAGLRSRGEATGLLRRR